MREYGDVGMRILLVVYDNDSYISWFPQGIAYIASALRNEGHEVVIYNQDVYHYPDEQLTTYLNKTHFDVVGIGVVGGYYQYRKLLKLSEAINASKDRPFYVIGGHGPSPEPEYFLRKSGADVVVIGEGEETIVEVMNTLGNSSHLDMSKIKGIAYLDPDGKCVITPRRNLIQDIDKISLPAWDLFPMDHYVLRRGVNSKPSQRVFPVLSGRGCPFHCNFCYRLDKGFRARTPESIIDEIQKLKRDYNINYIIFSDEILMASVERTTLLCEALIKAKLDIAWDCCGRLNYAKPPLLKLMKRAGCNYIGYGVESFNDSVLKVMKKNLTTKQITSGLEATLEAGIIAGVFVMFGNIGETKEDLNRTVNFLLNYKDYSELRTIRPVTPYPGSPLYYYAIEKGLLKDCADFYENKHTNSDLLSINFTDLTDEEFNKALLEANTALITQYYDNALNQALNQAKKLYLENDS